MSAKHRRRPGVQHRVRGRHERHRRGDRLVTGPETGHHGRPVERGGPGAERHRVARPGRRLQRGLECRNARPGRQPVGTQGIADGGDVRLVDDLARVGEEGGPHRRAAVDRQAQGRPGGHQRTVAPVASCGAIQSRTRASPVGRSTCGSHPRTSEARRGSQRSTAISLWGWMCGRGRCAPDPAPPGPPARSRTRRAPSRRSGSAPSPGRRATPRPRTARNPPRTAGPASASRRRRCAAPRPAGSAG